MKNKIPRKSTLTEKAHAFNRRKFNWIIPTYKGGINKIAMLSDDGKIIKLYMSVNAAARDNCVEGNQVSRCYNGRNKIKKKRLCFSKKLNTWVTFVNNCKVVKKIV